MTEGSSELGVAWRITAASVPGNSHVSVGTASDDAWALGQFMDGTAVVAVVADGAGSRSGTSAFGSHAACQAVIARADSLVEAANWEADAEIAVRTVFGEALAAVETRAAELELPAGHLATTLAVAVITPTAAVVAQVGDGIIVCELEGRPQALVPESKGEYANETVFLTSTGAIDDHLRVQHLPAVVRRFALSTDGLRYKILKLQDGGEPFEPFFDAIWRKTEEAVLSSDDLATWLDGLDDQTGDDKTLVVGALTKRDLRTEFQTACSPSPSESGWTSPSTNAP